MRPRPTCETCPYWYPDRDVPPMGECRRLAPRPAMADQFSRTETAYLNRDVLFPGTASGEWCGEHPDFPAWIATRGGPER